MTEAANTTQTNQQSSSQQSQSQSTGQESGGGSSNTQTQQATVSRPDWLPEAHWDAATNAIKPEFATHFKELSDLKSAHDARIAARPPKPDGYELKFNDGFTPEVAVAFKPDDPRVALLRDFAHKNNWTQAEFSEALQIESAKVSAENKLIAGVIEAENKKLGVNATARVEAVKNWLGSVPGWSQDFAKEFLDAHPRLASHVEALEKLQLAFTSQGSAPHNGGGREPPAPPPASLVDRWYGGETQRKVS